MPYYLNYQPKYWDKYIFTFTYFYNFAVIVRKDTGPFQGWEKLIS